MRSTVTGCMTIIWQFAYLILHNHLREVLYNILKDNEIWGGWPMQMHKRLSPLDTSQTHFPWKRWYVFHKDNYRLFFFTFNITHGLKWPYNNDIMKPRRRRTQTECTKDVQKTSKRSSKRLMYVRFTFCV